jgi:hypothetical protein
VACDLSKTVEPWGMAAPGVMASENNAK